MTVVASDNVYLASWVVVCVIGEEGVVAAEYVFSGMNEAHLRAPFQRISLWLMLTRHV